MWTGGYHFKLPVSGKFLKFHTVERHVVCDKPLWDSMTCEHIFYCHDNYSYERGELLQDTLKNSPLRAGSLSLYSGQYPLWLSPRAFQGPLEESKALSGCFAGVADRNCTWIPTCQLRYWYLAKTLHYWPALCTSLSQGMQGVFFVGFRVAGCGEQLCDYPWTLTPRSSLFHLGSSSKVLSQLVSLLWSAVIHSRELSATVEVQGRSKSRPSTCET